MEDTVNLLDGLDVDIPVEPPAGTKTQATPSGPAFFGPYQLIQDIGAGGVAKVMRARHIHPGYAESSFAIKILHDELSQNPQVVALFRNEAYVLSMLNHANIVRTFEAGVQDQKLFIAMEYIDGRDLDELAMRCKRARQLIPIPVVLHIIGEILKGLDYAHALLDADGNRLNLVHRDVNPANVFLSYDGHVKLGDFGVSAIAAAEVEKARELAGKLGYFAPEQLEGAEVDQRADLFAVGVMLYEVLTGERLFVGDDTDKVMRLNRRAKVPRPSKVNPAISPELEAILLKALERRPQDRYETAGEMLQALQPMLPAASDMSLGVAALVRKVFLREHLSELQLREGLAGVGPDRGSGQLIALCTRDVKAQAAFNELLLSRGYRVETHEIAQTFVESVSSLNPPDMILVDVASAGFAAEVFNGALANSTRLVPVVAVTEGLEPQWIRAATAVGAVDILYKPFNIDRVLAAVRATIMAATTSQASPATAVSETPKSHARVLLLSIDLKLVERVTNGLQKRGFEIDVTPTLAEGVERVTINSYQAVIFDSQLPSCAAGRVAESFRGRAGLGLVPIIYLADAGAQLAAGSEADRSAVRSRNDPAVVLAETINRLRADIRHGRTFVRFTTDCAAELRYGGRVFAARAVDMSRGGVMLRCEQMPPVGTDVSVSFRLGDSAPAVEATGHVVRVDLPTEGAQHDAGAGIGVEFDRFAGKGEADLIHYLSTFDRRPARRQTIILGAPPRHSS
ncbi:MAG: protein kinase [Deltaproteobacteria bacterium]|nr:protein kinase [Deltaproteobacteria bacterium]